MISLVLILPQILIMQVNPPFLNLHNLLKFHQLSSPVRRRCSVCVWRISPTHAELLLQYVILPKNIIAIEEKKYHYILGARIKNESKTMQETILSTILKDGESTRIVRENGSSLILSYKENRAKKTSIIEIKDSRN